MAQAFNAYIDEAGDEGWTRLGWRKHGVDGSSEWLIVAAVVVPAEVDSQRMRVVDELRAALGRTDSRKPLHWRNLRNDHSKKRRAMDILAGCGFRVCVVALWKPPMETRAPALRSKKGYLYNWACRLLVERLSWIAEEHRRTVNLFFEHRATTSYGNLQLYIRALHDDPKTSITKGTIGDVHPVQSTIKGVQVADFYASAVSDALEYDLDGYTTPDYLLRVRDQLWCPPRRDLFRYGFKIYPDQGRDLDRYPWLDEL